MSAHTPGPWQVAPHSSDDEHVDIVAEYQEIETKDGRFKQAHWIAECDAGVDHGDDREVLLQRNFANARLIAAAPKLFDLARTIVAICDDGNVNAAQLACMEGSPLVGEARAVIAEVEGES